MSYSLIDKISIKLVTSFKSKPFYPYSDSLYSDMLIIKYIKHAS